VADDQKVVSLGRGAILGRIYFFIGTVDAYAQNFDQHTAAILYLVN